tara:strand:- start:603 stop:1049 length:447 start_codon:yes stop_codon:yes gene_type:complete
MAIPIVPAIGLLFAGINAYGQYRTGIAQRDAKNQEAYNLEIQAEQDRLIALQNENRRRKQASILLASNLADQAYKGRYDQSFDAFLEENENIVSEDIGGIQLSAFMADRVSKQRQEVARAEGRALFQAGLLGAATTLGTGYYNYRRLA